MPLAASVISRGDDDVKASWMKLGSGSGGGSGGVVALRLFDFFRFFGIKPLCGLAVAPHEERKRCNAAAVAEANDREQLLGEPLLSSGVWRGVRVPRSDVGKSNASAATPLKINSHDAAERRRRPSG